MKTPKGLFKDIILPFLSFVVAMIALFISLYSNHLAKQNLELSQNSDERLKVLQKPLMRAVINFITDRFNKENEGINIYNDGPVLTDFSIEAKRFFLVDNSVLIPTSTQPEMSSQTIINSSQGLITTLRDISLYDFLTQHNIPDSIMITSEDSFWELVEWNILLKINYSDVYHKNTVIYLMLSQTQTRGKYLENRDAELLLNLIRNNQDKVRRKLGSYTNENLINLVKMIKHNTSGLTKLDEATFNRIPFKYSKSTSNTLE